MPGTTPPKGRPTPGRRDRNVAQQRLASRRRIIRYAWGVFALAVLLALLVLGTGTGGDALTTNLVLPALALGPARLRLGSGGARTGSRPSASRS